MIQGAGAFEGWAGQAGRAARPWAPSHGAVPAVLGPCHPGWLSPGRRHALSLSGSLLGGQRSHSVNLGLPGTMVTMTFRSEGCLNRPWLWAGIDSVLCGINPLQQHGTPVQEESKRRGVGGAGPRRPRGQEAAGRPRLRAPRGPGLLRSRASASASAPVGDGHSACGPGSAPAVSVTPGRLGPLTWPRWSCLRASSPARPAQTVPPPESPLAPASLHRSVSRVRLPLPFHVGPGPLLEP